MSRVLQGRLSCRSVMEQAEVEWSERRRREGAKADRHAVWQDILESHTDLLLRCLWICGDSMPPAAIAEAMVDLYARVSRCESDLSQRGEEEAVVPIRLGVLSQQGVKLMLQLCKGVHVAYQVYDADGETLCNRVFDLKSADMPFPWGWWNGRHELGEAEIWEQRGGAPVAGRDRR